MLKSKDTNSWEYWEWVANVWKLNHLRNLHVIETEKAKIARIPYSKGLNPKVAVIKESVKK